MILQKKIGSNQQAISIFEKNEHNPSLRLFHTIVNALGYELQIVKKNIIVLQTSYDKIKSIQMSIDLGAFIKYIKILVDKLV